MLASLPKTKEAAMGKFIPFMIMVTIILATWKSYGYIP